MATRLFDDDIGRIIAALIDQVFVLKWENFKKWLEGKGLIGKYLAKLLEPILKPLIQKICDFINNLVRKIIDKYIKELLKYFPNPLAPPMLKMEMGYRPPLLPGSLFKILFSKRMVLRRVNGEGEIPWKTKDKVNYTSVAVYSSGGRIDIPLSLVKLFTKGVNIIPGDCSH